MGNITNTANLHKWILGFALTKFLVHLYTNNLYGLHRDEYLYIDEGKHLAWGFMEIPPFLPFLAGIGDLLGNQSWIYKLFPAIAGATIIYVIGRIIIELGGKQWAVIIAGIALLFSPSLLRSSSLFQPVIWNQLLWLICAYWVLKIIKENKDKYYYFLGITAGIAFLNKYSIVFYIAALAIGLLLTPQRTILFKKATLIAFGIAVIIAAPNLYWQYDHGWPVIAHMNELQETQLVHIHWAGFIKSQFRFHMMSGILWMVGAYAIFRYIAFYRYRYIVLALIATVMIIGSLSGKAYYTIGAFYILFPFGAIALEKMMEMAWLKYAILTSIIIVNLPIAPLGTPLIPIQHFADYSASFTDITGMDDFLYWEDGKRYDLPQDYADMHGWEEIVEKVATQFHALPDSLKSRTILFGASYGHAGALNFYKDKYQLPEAYSSNASYLWWADENAQFDQVICVMDNLVTRPWTSFNSFTFLDSLNNPYARDPGYIYLMHDAHADPNISWKAYLESERGGN